MGGSLGGGWGIMWGVVDVFAVEVGSKVRSRFVT